MREANLLPRLLADDIMLLYGLIALILAYVVFFIVKYKIICPRKLNGDRTEPKVDADA